MIERKTMFYPNYCNAFIFVQRHKISYSKNNKMKERKNIDKSVYCFREDVFRICLHCWHFVCSFQHLTKETVQLSIQFIQIVPQKFYRFQSCQEHKREEEREERKHET